MSDTKFLSERIAELKTPEEILDAIALTNGFTDFAGLAQACKGGQIKELAKMAMRQFAEQQAITYFIAMDKRQGPHCFLDDQGHAAYYKMFSDNPDSINP